VSKTKGIVYLDEHGALKCAGKHGFHAVAPKSNKAVDNFQLRNALVETFRKNNATDEFLEELQSKLGLTKNGLTNGQTDSSGKLLSSKPIERRLIKQMIEKFPGNPAARESENTQKLLDRTLENVTNICNDIAEKLGTDSPIVMTFKNEVSPTLDNLKNGALMPREAFRAIEKKLTMIVECSIVNSGSTEVKEDLNTEMAKFDSLLNQLAEELGVVRHMVDEFEVVDDKQQRNIQFEMKMASYVRRINDNPTDKTLCSQLHHDEKMKTLIDEAEGEQKSKFTRTKTNLVMLARLRLVDLPPPMSASLFRRLASFEINRPSWSKGCYYHDIIQMVRTDKQKLTDCLERIKHPKPFKSKTEKLRWLEESAPAFYEFCRMYVKKFSETKPEMFDGADNTESSLRVFLSVVEAECPEAFSEVLETLKADNNIDILVKEMRNNLDFGVFDQYAEPNTVPNVLLNQQAGVQTVQCLEFLQRGEAYLHHEYPL